MFIDTEEARANFDASIEISNEIIIGTDLANEAEETEVSNG